MKAWIFLLIAVVLLAPARGHGACNLAYTDRVAARVRTLQGKLLAVQVGGKADGALETNIPVQARPDLLRLKEALSAVASAYLACQPQSVDAETVKAGLAGLTARNEPPQPRNSLPDQSFGPLDNIYGSSLETEVRRLTQPADLIAVRFTFSVNCGEDNLLLVYQRKRGGWTQVLRLQSSEEDNVGEALGAPFHYQIVPDGSEGGWIVAASHSHPWCSSNWNAMDIDAVRPIRNGHPQKTLMGVSETYYRGGDKPATLKLVQDGFEVRFDTGDMDTDLFVRTGIYRYAVMGGRVTRVQPIATNSRNFIDAWLEAPWSDARRWTSGTGLKALEHEHDAAEREAKAADTYVFYTYGAVLACSDTDHFQVELDEGVQIRHSEGLPDQTPHYFQVRQGDNAFTLLSATSDPDPRCKGGNLIPLELGHAN